MYFLAKHSKTDAKIVKIVQTISILYEITRFNKVKIKTNDLKLMHNIDALCRDKDAKSMHSAVISSYSDAFVLSEYK